jgi:diguanylate cyclase (GGDEF)-like protein/PAS domain S-box-containing protein
MATSDIPPKDEKIIVFDGLFRQQPKIEQMRDPLKTLWNTELVDGIDSDNEDEQLLKLIDFSQMNSLFESFLVVMGLPVAIIDLKGAVLASSKWQRLCVEFHRANEGTLKRCLESDRSIYAQLEAGKTYSSHQCSNGLIDCASPIVIEGHHLANLFIGQFFVKQPDLDFFKQQQQTFGFDETKYFEAIAEVPVIDEDKLPTILTLLVDWAQQIAARSLAEKRTLLALSSVEQQIKERTKELETSHALLQTAQRAAQMGYYLIDLLTETWTNDAQFDEIFGIDSHFNRDFAQWRRILYVEDVQRVMSYFQQSINNHEIHPSIEYRIIRPNDGALRWIAAWGLNFYDEQDKPIQQVGMIQDITERKATEETIKQLAFYDPLTQLPNRRLLQERVKHSIKVCHRTGKSMAVLMMDLDKFKLVNDTLGHTAGDELLRQVAERIKNCLREMDTVARLGGDEFVVVIEEVINDENIAKVADIIINTLSQPFTLYKTHQVSIGVSIGIAIYPQHGDSLEVLMDNADIALYRAKDNGRGCFVYFS